MGPSSIYSETWLGAGAARHFQRQYSIWDTKTLKVQLVTPVIWADFFFFWPYHSACRILSLPTRDWIWALDSERAESWPLDHQGTPGILNQSIWKDLKHCQAICLIDHCSPLKERDFTITNPLFCLVQLPYSCFPLATKIFHFIALP